jgi:hypothetical protein
MIINKKNILVFGICFVIYLMADIIFNDTGIYLLGGIFGVFVKWLGIKDAFYIIWFIFLVGVSILYINIENKHYKILLIIFLWALLYLIDLILYEITHDISNIFFKYNHILASVILKSFALSWIYNKGHVNNRKPLSD